MQGVIGEGCELAESTNPRKMTLPADEKRDYSLCSKLWSRPTTSSRGEIKALGSPNPHRQLALHNSVLAWNLEFGGCWGSKKSFPMGKSCINERAAN